MLLNRHLLSTAALLLTGLTVPLLAQQNDKPDLGKQPTLYVVGYAHLDTEWRWEYPLVIDEYLHNTLQDNFRLIEKYPHYVFNFSGANRYRLMKEYFPQDFERMKRYVRDGRWFPAGSSMEEGDVNAPSAEAIIRQVLYGNDWFRKELGKSSAEFMLPDCFGFPASLPTILAHAGVKGFSTQKLTWGSSAAGGGPESLEKTPEGTPFNVGVWVGPDGESVIAGVNPGSYGGGVSSDLSKPLPPMEPDPAITALHDKLTSLEENYRKAHPNGELPPPDQLAAYEAMQQQYQGMVEMRAHAEQDRFQDDWAARVANNGKVTGVFADYHYYGTGDIGGAPDEDSVKRLEAIVTKGTTNLAPGPINEWAERGKAHPDWPVKPVGDGPVHVISATADQMFLDITPAQAMALPRYTGEMELTNHSAGSLTSQAYQKRWIRTNEVLADAAEKASVTAAWLGARTYPLQRLNDAWTLMMGAHFHDLAAGTATPRSYEFAWNDDIIAMNQFAGVLESATEGVAQALDTKAEGTAVVVYNPLNIAREDVVEADLHLDGAKSVRVFDPVGKEVPAQLENGRVLFLAQVPSVGYAVYDVRTSETTSAETGLKVSDRSLENAYYRLTLNDAGDVASIWDKALDKELLAEPVRLALSYDNPKEWPAWNMDWDQEQAAPREYVSGPAQIRVVEHGPVRAAIEVTRETAGSKFVQTIRLSAGDAGKHIEWANAIDWKTRERNLKAVFALTATNENATYNWDIGTVERPTAQPRKFEVPSHQWIDLTDMSGTFGGTLLTDSKNGSDKPNDHTMRLTLIRTPGVRGGYPDQATQDIGHHEFMFGFAGHAQGWRDAQTDWQAQRLNTQLVGFATAKHDGTLGRSFSLLTVSNPRVRVLAVKKAENSDEVVVRMVELDGKPHQSVKVQFAAPLVEAREVNGQEQPVGPAALEEGALVTSFSAYQPRTFAVRLAAATAKTATVESAAVTLPYDTATATRDSEAAKTGFDGKGNALPAEMLPSEIAFGDVKFHLADSHGSNAVTAKGQTLKLPAGHYTRVYILAASADGDQTATFDLGGKVTNLTIEDWGGFIGQWDDRSWSGKKLDANNADYGDMTGLKPGFIKRADLAWYSTHHHDAAGKNVTYRYSYLFAYALDLPAGATTLKLPKNDKVRILAVSVVNEQPAVQPVQPLYDVLPAVAVR
ncbi:MAG: glycoside hydrolase family 38 C-terminal domain-containing protein [Terracidiphilus sp.]|nr:glycoside hydrolase family 38 C-terminal domain-containing protein [Terracidiphilus sp.]